MRHDPMIRDPRDPMAQMLRLLRRRRRMHDAVFGALALLTAAGVWALAAYLLEAVRP